jgi:exopolysaccharide biosynthesis polyprenyl glycosylphosphotransferase
MGQHLAHSLQERQWMGLDLVGFLDDLPASSIKGAATVPILGQLEEAERVVKEHAIDDVIVTLSSTDRIRTEELLKSLIELPVNVRVVPDFVPLAYLRTSVREFAGLPLVTLKEPVLNGTDLLTKRALDLLVASAMLALSWPAMALLALAIRLDSPGPAFFTQERVGWNGQLFRIVKLRTMYQGSEEQMQVVMAQNGDGQAYLNKNSHDPRITRLGKHLRRWSLDELPQLFNVLKGDMSMVGPRPELPLLVQGYQPWQYKRLAVLPGMTGWWQVTGRSDRPSNLHVDADLYYITNYSLWLDIEILLRTLGAIISGRGAY